MNIPEKLEELGMVKLQKDKSINGFDKVVTFVLPDYVQEILKRKYDLQSTPDIAIIRRGRIEGRGKSIERQRVKQRLSYSLACYDDRSNKFQIVLDNTGKKVKRVLGSMDSYITRDGALFTAQKYRP